MAAPSAPPAGDPVLLTQWLFGLGVVLLYARDRFRGPEPLRGTTTFARYWTAQIGYSVSRPTTTWRIRAARAASCAGPRPAAWPSCCRGAVGDPRAAAADRSARALDGAPLRRMVSMAAALGAALGLLVPHF